MLKSRIEFLCTGVLSLYARQLLPTARLTIPLADKPLSSYAAPWVLKNYALRTPRPPPSPNKPSRGTRNIPRKVVQRGDRVMEARRLRRKRTDAVDYRCRSASTSYPAASYGRRSVGTSFSKQESSTRCHHCISEICYHLRHHNFLSLPSFTCACKLPNYILPIHATATITTIIWRWKRQW